MASRNDSKQRHEEGVDVDMKAEIDKLLNEPTRFSEQSSGSKQQRSHGNGEGARIVGGRTRRFTESVAVSNSKYSAIQENGEWKADGDDQTETGEVAERVAGAGGAEKGIKSSDVKGGKPGTLVKTERLPYGKNSRHSRTGLRGVAKKGGAGGKCVWGKPGSELQAAYDTAALDAGDPNYDSNNEGDADTDKGHGKSQKKAAARLSDEELATRIGSVLKEFFEHANIDDCIDSLGEIAFGRYVPTTESHSSSASGSPAAVPDAPPRLDGVSPSDSGYAISIDGKRGAATDEFAAVFGESPQMRSYLVVHEALVLSFERHSADRELVSQLLSELHTQHRLSRIDFACGFQAVLRDVADLRTDCPDAPKWTGMFLARAIDDDVLDGQAFLAAFRGRSRSPSMTLALETCSTMLELRKPRSSSTVGNGFGHAHAAVSGSRGSVNSGASNSGPGLWNIWGLGGGATRSVNSLVREIRMIIDEYITSDDLNEALRCVAELDVPHFHHELVYQAVLVVLETAHSPARGAIVSSRMCTLLHRFADAGVLPVGELEIGFRRIFSELSDLELDVPRATSAFEQFAALCQHQSFLPRSVLKEIGLAKGGRKRFMSEADASVLRPGTATSLKFASDL